MNNKTILAVDDNSLNLDILVDILYDYDVIATTSGIEALEIVNQEKIDLILLDIMMPDIDGYEVCKKIKENPHAHNIPVLFITAKTDKESIDRAYTVGGADYVAKPFNPLEIISRVKTQLSAREEVIDLKYLVEKTRELNLLLVDEVAESRENTINMLSKFFNTIDVAMSGSDGLEKYKKNNKKYDIVLTDIQMAKMNGLSMSKEILKINNSQHIIVSSATNQILGIEEILNMGISYFLKKPIHFHSLTKVLNKIMCKIIEKNYEYNKYNEIQKLNNELDALVDSFDTYVIASRTDLKGKITYASKAYEIISGYTEEYLLGKPHNIVRHPDMPRSAFKEMWNTIKEGKLWKGDVKNLREDGSFYWVKAYVAPYFDKNNKHIGYNSIRIDITAQKEVEKLNTDVTNLLDNAGQGFLSFNNNLQVMEGYSKECLHIFAVETIVNLDIAELLFGNNFTYKDLFMEGMSRILNCEDEMSKELFLSLLPVEHSIQNKNIKIIYKLLEGNKFMLILTDITATKKLESKIKEQSKIQSMIVAVASNRNDFVDLKNDFEYFMAHPSDDITTLLRELHTYKGVFAQKEMVNIVGAIHHLETDMNEDFNNPNHDIQKIFEDSKLESAFKEDLQLIENILGKDYFITDNTIQVKIESIEKIEKQILDLSKNNEMVELDEVASSLEKLKEIPIYTMLNNYPLAVKKLATNLEKYINPLEIIGDRRLTIPLKMKPFCQSLIHLFNNCVEHGIEDIETRMENQKNEIGEITCHYTIENRNFCITISDDGGGIDTNKLVENALKNGICMEQEIVNMDENKKLFLIFADSLSTKNNISLTSGRGVGMSSIKQELDKCNGKINIQNKQGFGVKFTFILPLIDTKDKQC